MKKTMHLILALSLFATPGLFANGNIEKEIKNFVKKEKILTEPLISQFMLYAKKIAEHAFVKNEINKLDKHEKESLIKKRKLREFDHTTESLQKMLNNFKQTLKLALTDSYQKADLDWPGTEKTNYKDPLNILNQEFFNGKIIENTSREPFKSALLEKQISLDSFKQKFTNLSREVNEKNLQMLVQLTILKEVKVPGFPTHEDIKSDAELKTIWDKLETIKTSPQGAIIMSTFFPSPLMRLASDKRMLGTGIGIGLIGTGGLLYKYWNTLYYKKYGATLSRKKVQKLIEEEATPEDVEAKYGVHNREKFETMIEEMESEKSEDEENIKEE